MTLNPDFLLEAPNRPPGEGCAECDAATEGCATYDGRITDPRTNITVPISFTATTTVSCLSVQ